MQDQVRRNLMFFGIVYMLFVVAILLTSCATTSQFNSDDEQDGPCYSDYGGQTGYCERGVSR